MHMKFVAGLLLLFYNVCCHPGEKKAVGVSAAPVLADTLPKGLLQLKAAYPDFIADVAQNSVIFKDGTTLPYDRNLPNTDYAALLNQADLKSQMMQKYTVSPPDDPIDTPGVNFDPGRLREEAFFKKMYGSSAAEVKTHLTEIVWMPHLAGQKILVTNVNGVSTKLQEISAILDTMPQFKAYLTQVGGTFNWRSIKGTARLSTHSFGITIDINTSYSNYWQWDCRCTDENSTIKYKNRIPLAIVRVFEQHGFIWGGRWYHYDTMHFEYRPELLIE